MEMFRFSLLSVDAALEDLATLRKKPPLTSDMKNQIQTLELELKLLKMPIFCFRMDLLRKFIQPMHRLFNTGIRALSTAEFKDWNFLVSELQEQIVHIKPTIRNRCLDFLDGSPVCDISLMFELIAFLDLMLSFVKVLVRFKPDKIAAVKLQIQVVEQKIKLFTDFADFVRPRCTCSGDLKKLFLYILDWARKAASLLLLYWIDGAEEQTASRLNHSLTYLLKVMNPCTPEVTGMYLRVLKSSEASDSDNHFMGEIVSNVVDFLLESVVVPMKDCMLTLRDGLIILTTFLMNPPKSVANPQKLVQIKKQVDAILDEAVSVICSLSDREIEYETDQECDHGELMKKIDNMILSIYLNIINSSGLNFPKTNVLGFIEFLLERLANVKERLRHNADLIPFAKHQIVSIHEELTSVRPFLKDIQDDQKDLWMKIVNVAYQADYAVDSSQIKDFPVWHTMINLSHVRKQIKLIESEVQIIKDNHRQETGVFTVKVGLNQTQHAQTRTSSPSEVVVGFQDEVETVIDKLTIGSEHLKFISIVGMPGIGKTTLAKKVYNDARVQSYFHKCAWCTVSQSFVLKELLLAILDNLSVEVDGISDMEEEDLAHMLRKSLMGRRYIIVMDDIWDNAAWEKLKLSFPDNVNGSKIIFTSRNQNLKLVAEHDNYTHSICSLSNEESLILLQEKIKLKDGIPSHLSQIAKQIVKICKGLPLSIVVVAGLLGRESQNLDWWKHIAERLDSELINEGGYMDILQLSYNHLPDVLRPCFLYFGAFREDQVIGVQKLTQLWVAEGFIQKNGMRSLEDVGMEYLLDLIDRGLVIVAKRSPAGQINACQIHDQFHKLCLEKAREENFLCSIKVEDGSLNSIKDDQHRLCIHSDLAKLSPHLNFDRSSSVRTLLFNGQSVASFLIPSVSSLFNFLRVLNLESFHRFHFHWGGFDLAILSFTHLRYLGVNSISPHVPSSIANLQNLETFRVSIDNSEIYFPAGIWMMKNLKHIDLGGGVAVIAFGDDDLVEAYQLDNFDSLSTLALGDSDDAERMLRRMPRVRKLSVIKFSKRCCDQGCIQFPHMDFLSKLESLKLRFDSRVFHKCHFSFPSTLKKLSLSKLCRPWSTISVIAMLPYLEVLKLLTDAFIGEYWEGEDEQFLKLKYLKLQNLDIVKWSVSTESFPSLEALVVDNCFKLEDLPSTFRELSTLKIIKLYGCFKAESSVRQILEEQQDMGNDLQVLIKDNKYEWGVIALVDDELAEASRLDRFNSLSMLALDDNDAERMLRRLPRTRELRLKNNSRGDCFQGCTQLPMMDFLTKLEALELCFERRVFHTCHFSFPSTLKKLFLSKFSRPWSAMSVIGKLPHLEILKLVSDAFEGKYWKVEDEQFLKLKYLKLEELNIVKWNASTESFPCLEELVVLNCPDLEVIPSTFGELSSLKIVKIYDCPKAKSSVQQVIKSSLLF